MTLEERLKESCTADEELDGGVAAIKAKQGGWGIGRLATSLIDGVIGDVDQTEPRDAKERPEPLLVRLDVGFDCDAFLAEQCDAEATDEWQDDEGQERNRPGDDRRDHSHGDEWRTRRRCGMDA